MTAPARILLAEDDRILRKAGEIALRRHGYLVTVAVDGEDALVKARAERPDLVLLDVMMPKFDGFEVLAQLKADAATRDIPVIMLSNLGDDSAVQQAIGRGARAFLVKSSVRPDELVAKVAETLKTA
jgi:PleD family two-component response regulator